MVPAFSWTENSFFIFIVSSYFFHIIQRSMASVSSETITVSSETTNEPIPHSQDSLAVLDEVPDIKRYIRIMSSLLHLLLGLVIVCLIAINQSEANSSINVAILTLSVIDNSVKLILMRLKK